MNKNSACKQVRKDIVRMALQSKTGHISSALSMVEILVCSFFNMRSGKDKFILSKGHGALCLYATLKYFEYMTDSDIMKYHNKEFSFTSFISDPFPEGVFFTSGSLGHGLSVAVGSALSDRLNGNNYRTICVVSDGELQEGSIWEAALYAGANKLNSLTVIIDNNKLQAFGETDDVVPMGDIAQKFTSFGFHSISIDGHDTNAINLALETNTFDKPLAIIANTTKGKGISFMENSLSWHYLPITEELEKVVKKEIGL
ncbi:transketolase [Halobacteriovorax marinus]|nr:transketolase [Halobacteriovorax marinus]